MHLFYEEIARERAAGEEECYRNKWPPGIANSDTGKGENLFWLNEWVENTIVQNCKLKYCYF